MLFDVREKRQTGNICMPDSAGILLIDNVFEVELQRVDIRGGLWDSFGDLHDDGTETGGVEVDFLVVRDFADIAGKLEKGLD